MKRTAGRFPDTLPLLTLIPRWFHPTAPLRRAERDDYVLLALIVAAGAWLRFWGLGYAGLHGDEDIMGLAARGLLETGTPVMPSDMVYVRALLHTYIIAGSMWLLGDSEWAMRVPSAIVGSLVPVLAFLMGRRFLDPKLNLGFAAVMAFLPIMIEISQTARMYVFLVAGLLAFGSLIFKWEATGRSVWLAAAFAVWLLTMHFHVLAVFAAPMVLFPGLVSQSVRRLLQGGAAIGGAFVAYLVNRVIHSRYYPGDEERLTLADDGGPAPLALLADGPVGAVAALAAVAVVLVAVSALAGAHKRRDMLAPAALLAFGIIACAFLHYHIGGIALLLGVIFWYRAHGAALVRLIPAGLALAAMAAVQLLHLHGTGEFEGRQLIGALIGTPSVWPAIRFSVYSPVAIAAYLLILGFAAVRFARGARLPQHFMVFILGVWMPLAGIGFFTWNAPPRYMLGVLPFFIFCLLAGIAYVLREGGIGERVLARPAAATAVYLALLAAVINPLAAAVAASNDYRSHPDHKGAAEFVKSLNLGPNDLLIVEDAINQTFYLGHVDYHLLAYDIASVHAVAVDGALFNQYTGTPQLGTGEMLEAVLNKHRHGEIYIIGSGENFAGESRQRIMRAHGIQELLKSDRMAVLYEGRDGLTRVWRVVR